MPDPLVREYEKALEAIFERNEGAVELCSRRMVRTAPDDPRTLEIQGELALLREKWSTAEAVFEKLARHSDTEFVLIAMGRLGDLHGMQRNFEKALEFHRKVITLAEDTGHHTQLLNSWHQIALTEAELGRFQQSSNAYSQMRQRIQSLDDDDAEEHLDDYLEACQEHADVLRMMGLLEDARGLLNEVLEGYETTGNPIGVAIAQCSLGVICQIEGLYDDAEAHHLKSLELSTEEGWDEGLSMNYGNLAMLSIHRRDFDEAERYATLAYRIDREERDQRGRIHYYQTLTNIEFERGRLEKAEVYGQKALKLSERHGDREDIATGQSKLGVVYRKMGRFEESEKWTVLSLDALVEMGHRDGIAAQQFELAELRKAEGKISEANQLAIKALEQYQQLNAISMIREVREFIATLGD